MANLYGVANSAGVAALFNTIGNPSVACPASAPTAIMTSPVFVAPSAGYFFVGVWANVCISFGASVPTSVNVGVGIGAGAAANLVGTAVAYPPSAAQQQQFATFTVSSQVAWQAPGSTITLYLNPIGNPVTVFFNGSWAAAILLRGPDQ
jgi:hypothetical protein